jgi:rhodanese-related sulfurtransferase
MQKVKWKVLLGITLLILSAFALPSYGANDVPRIGTEELKDLLGSPDLVILDARTAKDWKKSDSKVAGAVRVDPHDVSSWEADFSKDNQTVVYCA